MKGNVVKLPTAASSYYTVRKARAGWAVELVTPAPGAPLRTSLYWHSERQAAVEEGEQVAARMQRPFKGRAEA